MKELSAVWEDLSDFSQANILELIGGKRNSNVVSGLLSNFDVAEEVIEKTADSTGSALEENDKYLDSIAGKMEVYNATVETFASSFISSDFIKGFVDLGTAIFTTLDAMIKVTDAFPLLAAGITLVISAMRAAKGHSINMIGGMKSMWASLSTGRVALKAITTDINVYNSSLKSGVTPLIQSGDAMRGYIQSLDGGKATMSGFKTYCKENGIAMESMGLAAKASSVAVSLLNAALSMGITFLAQWAFQKIAAVVDSFHDTTEELEEAYAESKAACDEINSQLETTADRISALQELSNNGTITLVEQEELDNLGLENTRLKRKLQLLEDIAKQKATPLNERLASEFDKEKYTLGTSYTGYYWDLQKQGELEQFQDTHQTELSNYSMKTSDPNAYTQLTDAQKQSAENAQKAVEQLQQEIAALDDAAGPHGIEDYARLLTSEYKELKAMEGELEEPQLERLAQNKDELLSLAEHLQTYYLDKYEGEDENTERWNGLLDNIYATIHPAEHLMSVLEKLPYTARAKLAEAGTSGSVTKDDIETLAGDYKYLSIAMEQTGISAQDIANDINIGSLSLNNLEKKTEDASISLGALSENIESLSGSYDLLKSAKSEMQDDGSISLDTLNAIIEAESDYIDFLYVENDLVKLNEEAWKDKNLEMQKAKVADYDSAILSLYAENSKIQSLIDSSRAGTSVDFNPDILRMQENNAEIDRLREELKILQAMIDGRSEDDASSFIASQIESMADAYEILSSARADMNEDGGLSVETIQAVMDAESEYINYLYEENGVIKLNTDAWEDRNKAMYQADITKTQSKIDSLRAENENIRSNPSAGQFGNIKISENNAEIQEQITLLNVLQIEMDELSKAGWDSEVLSFDSAVKNLNSMIDLQEAVSSSYTISASKAEALASVFPDILKSARQNADGQITLNEKIVNAFITGKESEIKVTALAEIEKLKAKRSVLQAGLDIVSAQIEAAQAGDGQMVQSAQDAGSSKVEIEQAVLSACEQAGIGEITASQIALAAMTGDWDTFSTLAQNAVYDLDDESATSFTHIMSNFATTTRNLTNNINEVVGAFNTMAAAAENSIEGTVTGEYTASISAGAVTGEGKEAAKGILASAFEAYTSAQHGGSSTERSSLAEYLGQVEVAGIEYSDKVGSGNKYLDGLESEQTALIEQIAAIDEQIATLNAIDSGSFFDPFRTGSGSGGSSKQVDEYIADIDDYLEAIRRLNQVQQDTQHLELQLENTDDLEEQIKLHNKLIVAHQEEQDALHNLNNLRDQTISAGAQQLQGLGFSVEYDAETNDFFVNNMEHLNELTATSVGEYGSLQEATNELRKNTEELIDTMVDLNEENQEGSSTWWDLKYAIDDGRDSIIEALDGIVARSNDLVDGLKDAYATLTDSAREYASTGYLSVDSLQAILALSPAHLSYLYNENGQLIINESTIQSVIAAKMEEMAVNTALSYARKILIAAEENDTATLTSLTEATAASSGATWDMAYATVGLAKAIGAVNGMDAGYFDDATDYIYKMQAVAKTATNSVSKYYDTLDDGYISQKDALDQILQLTQDMIQWENEEKIAALEEERDAYQDIIDQKREMIELAKEESDHDDDIADKLKEIAALQFKIDQLSLDDSREAAAQKAGLEEELSELQNDLADTQNDYAINAQLDALDKNQEAFEDSKDDEIKTLEDSLDSAEKLYQAAIERIDSGWDTLYSDLELWNYNYGSTLQTELETAWTAALEAAERYGTFVSALEGVKSHTDLGTDEGAKGTDTGKFDSLVSQMRQNSIDWWGADAKGKSDIETDQTNLASQVSDLLGEKIQSKSGNWYDASGKLIYALSRNEIINAAVSKMKQNSADWMTADKAKQGELEAHNKTIASSLSTYLKTPITESHGVWYINGKRLFDVYHSGGIAGNNPSLKQDEVMAILQKGEAVLDADRQDSVYQAIDFVQMLSDKLGTNIDMSKLDNLLTTFTGFPKLSDITPVTSSTNESVVFNPTVNITIHHDGAMTQNDAKRFGSIAAESVLGELKNAFHARGISSLGGALLK